MRALESHRYRNIQIIEIVFLFFVLNIHFTRVRVFFLFIRLCRHKCRSYILSCVCVCGLFRSYTTRVEVRLIRSAPTTKRQMCANKTSVGRIIRKI